MPAWDHTSDGNGELVARIFQNYERPEFMKSATISELEPRRVRSGHCADPVHNQFPCDTKIQCWLSCASFVEKQAEITERDRGRIRERLDRFADYWGIGAEFKNLDARYTELYKTAYDRMPDSSFAWVWVDENQVKDRRLCIQTPVQIKAAADYLEAHRDRFPLADRRVMAIKILDRADQLGADIRDKREFLERQAGHGWCSPQQVRGMLERRALYVKASNHANGPKAAQVYRDLAVGLEGATTLALQADSLVKLACQIDQLDRMMGIPAVYQTALPRPEDVIFAATQTKCASELMEHVATTTGAVYQKSSLARARIDDLRTLFGEEFADRVSDLGGRVDPEKLAEEIATLPRGDAELLEAALQDTGIVPSLRKAASLAVGLSRESLEGWSQFYQEPGAIDALAAPNAYGTR